jgi:hypothetical protein
MDWMDQYFDSDEQPGKRLDRRAQRIKEARPSIWAKLAEDIDRRLLRVATEKPGEIESGGFVKSQNNWLIRRIVRPVFEVSVCLQDSAILIVHDFRISTLVSSGDVQPTVVDIRCDAHRFAVNLKACLFVSQVILEPLLSGRKVYSP